MKIVVPETIFPAPSEESKRHPFHHGADHVAARVTQIKVRKHAAQPATTSA